METKAIIRDLRKTAHAVYLATDESVAADIAHECHRAADAIATLEAENAALREAIDRIIGSGKKIVRIAAKIKEAGDA